jgi:class 3 adenylate cyclase
MHLHHHSAAGEPRLRVVFADTSFAVDLRDCTTFGDIANRVDEIARLHEASPLFIDVRLGAHSGAPRIGAGIVWS